MHRSMIVMVLVLASCGGGGDESAPATSSSAPRSTVAASSEESTSSTAETTTAAAPETTSAATEGCAHVIDGEIVWRGQTATVSATVRSADTGWDKYADAWEVRSVAGDVLGVRELAHPHETEQPFTRSLTGVDIPPGVAEVVLAAHDSVTGWCGETFTLPVPARQ